AFVLLHGGTFRRVATGPPGWGRGPEFVTVGRVRSGPEQSGTGVRAGCRREARHVDHDGEGLALVIGGGSGIGAALVEAYRARGTQLVTWDIAGEPDVACDVRDP